MELRRDLAIVLRSIPFEDRHRVVTALTEKHGQISAMARNAVQSRRFGGSLEPFAASDWHFAVKPGAELHRLDEAQIRRPFEGLRANFERLSLASVFNDLMLRLAPRDEACPDLFKLHSNALAILEDAAVRPDEGSESTFLLQLLNGYLTKLLQWTGSQPRLLECLACGTRLSALDPALPLTCVIAEAGWVCDSCRARDTRHVRGHALHALDAGSSIPRVTPAAIVDFHSCLDRPIRQIPEACIATRDEHKELFRFLEGLMIYHLPGFDRRPMKGLRFLGLESHLSPG